MERGILLPRIIISDYTITPPIATSYHAIKAFQPQKEDTIFFGQTYKLTKSLLTHPRCLHRRGASTWPCRPCEIAFTSNYWTCAALLLDYYADFYAHDSALMQAIWFHLFDIWQESAAWLIDDTLSEVRAQQQNSTAETDTPRLRADRVRCAAKARTFVKNVKDTVELVEVVLWGRKQGTNTAAAAHPTQETILYDPRGEAWHPSGEYDTGPWISGIKPWCQFLYNGGPGVAPLPLPASFAKQQKNPNPNRSSHTNGNPDNSNQTTTTTTTTRYIPHSAIAILTSHTQRARTLASTHYTTALAPVETHLSRLKEFDAYAPVFPTPRHPVHTCTSPLTGHTVSYALGNGAPPVLRHVGFADPEMMDERADWALLDECVAICKGLDPYLGVSGEMMGGAGGEAEEEEAAFDVWTVVTTAVDGKGRKGGDVELGPLFDNWCGIKECELDSFRSCK
ncbi:hypothetical protein J3E74DRAFT_206766 [Bipolaris maydis]|nr:hypothetical protein J3E74DRAFT_206766 [Bipolaris maydis]